MSKNSAKSAGRQLGRAALFSLVRGACWAAGSAVVGYAVWFVQK